MPKNYRQLTEGIRNRINPDHFTISKSFSDELSTISYSEVLTYIRLAMKGVDPAYTQRSMDAGEKVKEHLVVLANKEFRYQGSIMTNTHIKGYSDIDLLVISDKFYQYDAYNTKQVLETPARRERYNTSSIQKLEKEVNTPSYTGDSMADLRTLRMDSERILSSVYSVNDLSKPKSIKIKNLSLNREVDVVIANWHDDVSSIVNGKGDYRGIQVYNKETNSQENPDYPFLSIKRINDRSSDTNGRLKKMIRFLKNVKGNSGYDIDLSSFDINAICYDIEVNKYQYLSFYELVPIIYSQLKSITTNSTHADNVVSVDGREYIFRYQPKKVDNIRNLLNEVESIYIDLKATIGI